MRKDFGKKPWIYPQPVLIIATYDEEGNPDIMNAAWGGVGDDTQIFICLDRTHKTTDNVLAKKAFTVSMGTREMLTECDYVGIVSAKKDPEKVAKSGFHLKKAEHVDAPMIEELPLCLECELISYEPEHCHLFGEIVNVSIDESILTEGKVDMTKFHPITFDQVNNDYYALGEFAGKAFSAGLKLKK